MTKTRKHWILLSGLLLLLLVAGLSTPKAQALVGPHTYTNSTTGDVFLGGDYIELGISKPGSFGTTSGKPLPPGFYGTADSNNIGMSTNPTGFGVPPDLRIDFFLPGSPEERWDIGYKESGAATTGTNSLLNGPINISDNVVTDESSGTSLEANSVGTLNGKLQTTQVYSFNSGDKFFETQVTLKNVGNDNLDSVRYMRSFDPDNTVFQGGSSETHNYIPYTYQAGDGKSVVIADTNVPGNHDPVFTANGSYSPILFYSSDSRARVSTFGFSNENPYAADAYDSALPKGTDVDADQAISIAFDVGTLDPGDSQSFTYYTSLDNRDFSTVVAEIQSSQGGGGSSNDDDNDGISNAIEDAGPNNGDANGDGIKDSQQSSVTSLPNPVVGGSAYEAIQAGGACTDITQASVKSSGSYGTDGKYEYPVGMTNYTVNCSAPGSTATIKIYYDKQYDTTNWVARKEVNGAYVDIPGATFGTATVGSKTVTTLTYDITDGGPLDADGKANGVIVDPAGPAVFTGATAPDTGLKPINKLTFIAPLVIGLGIVGYGVSKQFHAARRRP